MAILFLQLCLFKGMAQDRITVTGRITDSSGEPLPGAGVVVRGTSTGVASNAEGYYSLSFKRPSKGSATLLYSFIGMRGEERQVSSSTTINVTLKDDNEIDAVVVNGFYEQAKETFTGAVTTISGEELVQMSPNNLITGIAAVTPGMVIVENNAAGSNPNAIPQILIRGANSLITRDSEEGINNPLIILDGVEITLEELYDLDIFDIERVDVLKDASATILYGDQGANGVIVVERKRIGNEKVKLSYNFVPKYQIPDLHFFNLTNSAQKLEVERLAGLYDTGTGSMDEAYAWKLQQVRKGVNTDWMSAPLRISFGHTHSLSLTSRGEKLDFLANVSLGDNYGVMKGDNRRTFGLNFNISYHLRDKLTASFRTTFGMTRSVDSPYGKFSQYSTMNTYYEIYDEFGDLNKVFWFDPVNETGTKVYNPLYDATLSSFNKNLSHNVTNNLTAKWNITKYFYINGQASLGLTWNQRDNYVSPESAKELEKTDYTSRGSYTFSSSNGMNISGKLVANYGRSLDSKGSMFRISGGTNIKYTHNQNASMTGVGFLKDVLSDLSFAMNYDPSGKPRGTDNLSTAASFFANINASYRNRYYVDGSYNASGSSRFGAKNSFAPFWAAGAGWNVHNESFAKGIPWLGSLRLRYSFGYTGNVSFSYYQAKTVYEYNQKNLYYTGIGALPNQMGNPDLKWQRTLKNNVGISGTLFDDRLNFSIDGYSNTTYDLVMSIPLPPSVGASSMNVNFGEINNKGIDISLSCHILKTTDWFWSMTLTGAHVMDKINKISSSLKGQDGPESEDTLMPKLLYQEGGSQFDIYAMRSAGIDPATGREIFIRKNGEYTYNYLADERVAVGNTNPILQGSWINTLRYKGWSLNITTSYTFGSDYYNTTLQNKVENLGTSIYGNVDTRVFTDRWKEPGDISRFLGLQSSGSTYIKSERFVERRNELYISSLQLTYDFQPKVVSRFGLRKLVVGIGLTDVAHISTVKFERGTSYPYAQSFNLIFRPTF